MGCCLCACADARDPNLGPSEDDLEDLRELLGVAEDPAFDTADMDEAPGPESQQELQRLLAHIDSPVSAGSDYSVLQVCAWLGLLGAAARLDST